DGVVIELRIRAAERELEAVLPQRIAVTSPRIATRFGEDRHHLVPKAPRRLGGRKLYFDGHGERLPSDNCRELRIAIGDGPDQTLVVDDGDFGIGNGEL